MAEPSCTAMLLWPASSEEAARFPLLQNARFVDQLRMLYSPSAVYDVNLPFKLNAEPFGTVG